MTLLEKCPAGEWAQPCLPFPSTPGPCHKHTLSPLVISRAATALGSLQTVSHPYALGMRAAVLQPGSLTTHAEAVRGSDTLQGRRWALLTLSGQLQSRGLCRAPHLSLQGGIGDHQMSGVEVSLKRKTLGPGEPHNDRDGCRQLVWLRLGLYVYKHVCV